MPDEWNERFKIPQSHINWSRETLSVDYDDPELGRFHRRFKRLIDQFSKTNDLPAELRVKILEWSKEYRESHKVGLLMNDSDDEITSSDQIYQIKIKDLESIVNKAYRYNRQLEDNPSITNFDPIVPGNWIYKINDICRGVIVCKYLDGPKFLSKKVKDFLSEKGIDAHVKPVARNRGYYAYHVEFYFPIEIQNFGSGTVETIDIRFEMQITTQLQQALYSLTHPYYEKLRVGRIIESEDWQWEYESHKFKSSYVSHTLHLLESMILEIRDSDYFQERAEE